MFKRALHISFVLLSLLVSACGILPSAKPVAPDTKVLGIAPGIDPSGTWLYEEGGQVLLLKLDEQGNGEYPWKNGSFRTQSIRNKLWTGTWHQPGNNREGGYSIKMDADFVHGQGRWWYTRIGKDKEPKRPGGEFTIERQPSKH
jgi:hypothetical protein